MYCDDVPLGQSRSVYHHNISIFIWCYVWWYRSWDRINIICYIYGRIVVSCHVMPYIVWCVV